MSSTFLLLEWLKWWNKKRFAMHLANASQWVSEGGRLWERFRTCHLRPCHPHQLAGLRVRHVTLAGGGFRTMPYFGQLHFLRQGNFLDVNTHFYGASIGAFYAVAMAFETAGDHVWDKVAPGALDYCIAVRKHPFSMWGLMRNIFRRLLDEHLPDDVRKINGRVHIGLTYLLPTPQNCQISHFLDKSDLIDCVLASMHMPMWTRGVSPVTTFRGNLCLDGGFTSNEPGPSSVACKPRSLSRELWPSGASLQPLAGHVRTESDAEWHYKCIDRQAPLWQVIRPPPEETFMEEMERGWHDAQLACWVGFGLSVRLHI